MNRNINLDDLRGKRFGRLVIVSAHRSINPSTGYLNLIICDCLCDCGKKKVIRWTNLGRGVQSCGCYRREFCSLNNSTHGQARHGTGKKQSPAYRSWMSMIQRCTRPKNKDYSRYGAKGITVPKEWLLFENFYKDMGDRPEGTTLGRINNDQSYSKENCEWQGITTQNRNQKRTRRIIYKGQKYCLSELAEKFGLKITTLFRRVNAGWQIEDAVECPVNTIHWSKENK